MAMLSKTQTTAEEAGERRRFRRIGTRIEGRIVFAGVDVDCIVHEMSATGALVECLPLPALGTELALDVPDVGCARGIALRYDGELVSIELATPPERRDRLADRLILAAYRFPPEAPAD
ncbi:MAG TPA: PilZ domain-containing protein [Parvibaculum sp.]